MLKPIIASYKYHSAEGVYIVPATNAPANWHEQALAWLRGDGVTNQGRVRSDNIAARQYDVSFSAQMRKSTSIMH
jgi:hypothetical protein